jgi:uncharacterized membrane protein YcaP (DUF421 family)
MNSELAADMFVLGLPLAEKIIRPIVVYIFLIVGLRLAGKRELAQLNPFDLVVLLTISNTVQNAIIGEDTSVTGGIIGAFTLLSVNYMVIRFLFGHRRLDQIVVGKPTVLIRDGHIHRKGLARELITKAELMTILHRQGFARLEDVDRCELEPGGTFSITAREPRQHERFHAELLAKLDELSRQVSALREEVIAPAGGRGASAEGPAA